MGSIARRLLVAGAVLAVAAAVVPGVVSVWVDESGHTYLTDGDEPPAPGARRLGPDELSVHWGGRIEGPPVRERSASDPADRFDRAIRAARDDLERGELRRGLRELRRLHAAHPNRPEAAWLLAQVERRRGRLQAARHALESMLTFASPLANPWQEAAEALRREIDEELELAESSGAEGFGVAEFEAPHFRIVYDHRFAGRHYGERVASLLEQARAQVERTLGHSLDGRLDVHLYTRRHYLETYRHRFGFATVGFYDGAIHVVSARHPRSELQALLVHEYVHAVFRDALGGDRPFFLNEGIADREEERVRGRPRLSRSEWRQLLDALRGETWVPLGSIVEGFSDLAGARALLAYLESRAAVELIEARHPGAIAGWLERCRAGTPWQRALARQTGWNLASLEEALRSEVVDRFPKDPLAGQGRSSAEGE